MTTKYLKIFKSKSEEMIARLDAIKGNSPFTSHYSLPIESNEPGSPFVLFQIDDRAIPALTAEEWDNALLEKPSEFIPQ